MTFGPDEVLACPRCGAPLRAFVLRSANGFGASHWTDGYLHYPMYWRRPDVSRCRECRRFYWVEDAPHLGELPDLEGHLELDDEPPPNEPPGLELAAPGRVPPEWERAGHVHELGLEGALAALASGAADTPERELALRLYAFWRSSDRNRNWRKKKVRQKTPGDRTNADALRAILARACAERGCPAHALLLAELERQMGRFAEAARWLERILVQPLLERPEGPSARPRRSPRYELGWLREGARPRDLATLARLLDDLVRRGEVSVAPVELRAG